jgi:uncharacterized SAM-binding protein YcdF (DUF218 family)
MNINHPAMLEKSKKNRKGNGCLVPLLTIGGVFIMLWLMGAFLIAKDPLVNADVIVLLSGGKEDRLMEAVRLFFDGYGQKIILTQTDQDRLDPETNRAVEKMHSVINQGISQEYVILTQEVATSTYEEAQAVIAEMQYFGIGSCTVITDAFHSRRTKIIFNDAFRGSGIKVYIHPVEGQWYRGIDWWTHAEGWQVMASEWIKLIGYWAGLGRD